MKSKKFMAIPIFLIIALVLMGFAYAHWEKIVTINGKITTGKLDLIVTHVSHNDYGIDPDKDKDVASTTVIIDPNDPEKVIINITNAYPSYHVYVDVTVTNVGTIPVKLKNMTTTAPPCITVQIWDGLYEQIDPISWDRTPQYYQKDYTLYIHVEQCALQNTTYTFTAQLIYWNWNELP